MKKATSRLVHNWLSFQTPLHCFFSMLTWQVKLLRLFPPNTSWDALGVALPDHFPLFIIFYCCFFPWTHVLLWELQSFLAGGVCAPGNHLEMGPVACLQAVCHSQGPCAHLAVSSDRNSGVLSGFLRHLASQLVIWENYCLSGRVIRADNVPKMSDMRHGEDTGMPHPWGAAVSAGSLHILPSFSPPGVTESLVLMLGEREVCNFSGRNRPHSLSRKKSGISPSLEMWMLRGKCIQLDLHTSQAALRIHGKIPSFCALIPASFPLPGPGMTPGTHPTLVGPQLPKCTTLNKARGKTLKNKWVADGLIGQSWIWGLTRP